ncbi:hypothetical protein PR202_ga23450 [Eleusine coracana subsp. coracana]|uniref:Receptor kinase-like protein Xa21 n=1 Tax=Eleusine coracana subsp. coracana TaxID=191504 RepID=A0AAV5D5Q1_ELECO|nr:hypothetical protein PR202_ga23450 [Eleusine coracana subsp. coracana]
MAMRSLSLLLLLMLSASMYVSTFMATHVDDEAALLSFKAAAISGGYDDPLASWNDSIGGCCNWEGVRCRGRHQRVVALTLPSHGLTGVLSPAIGNLSSLRTLNISFNGFSGEIPASLSRLRRLHILDLSHNTFSGKLPVNLTSCINLKTMCLRFNQLRGCVPSEIGNKLMGLKILTLGPLPSNVGNLRNLNFLNLNGNQLSGDIPDEIGELVVLQELWLANNSFDGSMPQSLSNIKGLTTLSLSMNKLSGSIPDVLEDLTSLSELDISFNNLQGEVPKEGIFRNLANLSIEGNNEFCGGMPQLILPPCQINSKLMSKQRSHSPPLVEEQYERVSYHALANGTNGFSEANLLGKGSFGAVYKCTFQDERTITAVKVFNLELSGSTRSFVAECEALRRVRHRCLLKTITCCSSINHQGQEFKALVFEFMPNGSLNRWLHPQSGTPTLGNTLTLAQRLDIAIDIMDAMDYLHNHCQPPIVHCDIKPSNILIAEDMRARVGDFGISRILPKSAYSTLSNSNSTIGIRGSIGYVAPEYGEGSPISTIGDVYSLGILLLELFTGRSPTNDMFRGYLDLRKFSADALPDRVWDIADTAMWLHIDTHDRTTRSRIENCLISATSCIGERYLKHAKGLVVFVLKSTHNDQLRTVYNEHGDGASTIDLPDTNHHPSIAGWLKPVTSTKATGMTTMRPVNCMLLLVSFSMTATLLVADEAASLLAFKAAAISGANGDMLASWNGSSASRFCSWEGVMCGRKHRRVVALNLSSRGLNGVVSPAIGNLTFLRLVNLSFNGLNGDIPASLGRLHRLQVLDLSNNAFSGKLPANLSSCTRLKYMYLRFNQLHGRLPPELGDKLAHLRVLNLQNNSLTGTIPSSLANLSSLEALILPFNHLEGTIPPALGSIPGLLNLDLASNHLSGELPHSLYNLSSLEWLQLQMNMFRGGIPANIGSRFPKMQILVLSFNQFTRSIPASISNLTTLQYLGLSGNRLSGYVPSALGRLRDLEILHLHENVLQADDREGWEFITSLSNCSKLQQLFLSYNSAFTGQMPSSIGNLSSNLQALRLYDTGISGSIPSAISNLVSLTVLNVGNTNISGVIPESIGKLGNLVQLSLFNTDLSALIPSSIGNLSKLIDLNIQNCNLEGPIPASIGNLKNLLTLDLSMNRLNGYIPRDIFNAQLLSLNYLDLSQNSLSGPLPYEVGSLRNLNSLRLADNQLSGEIPDSLEDCTVLEGLWLHNNSFEGSIPQSLKNIRGLTAVSLSTNKLSGTIPEGIGTIRNLKYLFLQENNLSGPIPKTLQNLTSLSELDMSFNNLQGEVPKDGIFKNLSIISITGNNELCGGIPQLHLTPCQFNSAKDNRKGRLKVLAITLSTTGTLLLLAFIIAVLQLMLKKLTQRQKKRPFLTPIIEEHYYERVSYHTLAKGTNGFSEANLLGKGTFGAVYKCNFEEEGHIAAVKVFNPEQSESTRSFVAECKALKRVRHRCLIKIITCCSSINHQGHEFKALVFEFMLNGSLNDWLHPKSDLPTPRNTLSLEQRLDIAVNITDALDYLHNQCQPPIIHCDLKPSNILLAEDMTAKVGDFGISKILPENASKTLQNSNSAIGIRGTIGYVAPERIWEIADTTMWLHTDISSSIKRSRIENCLASVIALGISCSKKQPRERTPMQDVAIEMHAIRDAYLEFVRSLEVVHERVAKTLQ